MPTETAEVSIAAERAELQALVRAAIDGLNPGEREIIELSLVHELDADEVPEALGVSRNHAHAQLSRGRSQLERSLGALVVARTGRRACPVLEAMLTGWDGQMTVLMRKRIRRHIEQCDVCGERKRRELTPALFAGAVPMIALFPGFREQLLRMLANRSPAGLAHRLAVANRAARSVPTVSPSPSGRPGPHRGTASCTIRTPCWRARPRRSWRPGPSRSESSPCRTTARRPPGPRRVDPRRVRQHSGPCRGAAGRPAVGEYADTFGVGPWQHDGPRSLPVAGRDKLGGHRRILAVGFRVLGILGLLGLGLGWPRHLVGVGGPASPGFGRQHSDRDVHAHRRGRRGPRLLDQGRARASGHADGLPVIRIAGPRRKRDDHRDLNQPGGREREARRGPRRSRGHRDPYAQRVAGGARASPGRPQPALRVLNPEGGTETARHAAPAQVPPARSQLPPPYPMPSPPVTVAALPGPSAPARPGPSSRGISG